MGNFAILRVQKVKTMSSMAARGRHNFREQETPNADPDLLGQNLVEGAQSTDEMLKAISDLLPMKRRKDAVIGLEYLITASPEHFSNSNEIGYFRDAIAWLEAKHGKVNVICKTVHLDESTPHLAAFVVPLLGGKLNAKHFTGGAKALADMQTDFAEKVGKKHNLERGIERSKAVHQDNAKIKPMVIERLALKKQVKTLSDEVARLTKHVTDGGAAVAKLAHQKNLNSEMFIALNELEAKKKAFEAENEALKAENIGLNDLVTVTKNELVSVQGELVSVDKELQALKSENIGLNDLVTMEGLKTPQPIEIPQPIFEKQPEGVSVAPDGNFDGKILEVVDGYIIQNLGRRQICHRIAELGLLKLPVVGEYLEIQKRDGHTVAKVVLGKGLSR